MHFNDRFRATAGEETEAVLRGKKTRRWEANSAMLIPDGDVRVVPIVLRFIASFDLEPTKSGKKREKTKN